MYKRLIRNPKEPKDNDAYWMLRAYELALIARSQNEVPVGAVIIDSEYRLLSQGFNQVIQKHDPTAHAEIIAMRNAGTALGNHRLLHTTLYTTLEPCAMCAGAIVHARIARLVFATRDLKSGAAGSVYNLLCGYPLNHRVQIDEGIMQQASHSLLVNFFN